MASHPYHINEEEAEEEEDYYYDEEDDERPHSDDDHLGGYDDWLLFDTDDDEEDEDEDEDERISLVDDDVDVDSGSFDIDDDDDEEEEEDGGGGEQEANEVETDGGVAERVEEEIAGGEQWTAIAAESDRSSSPDCPICFRPWTADGPHRVCCFPCGHVHGRSCLEIWLQRCGETNGKCPQCNQKFGWEDIINLYGPSAVIPNFSLYKTPVHELSSQQRKLGGSFRNDPLSSNLGEERHGCANCSELQERVMDTEFRVSQLENFEAQGSLFRGLQNEVAELRTEMIGLASLQGEVAELKDEMAEMRSEMVEVAELQQEVARLKRENAEMRDVMIDAVDFIGEVDDLKTKMAEIEGEMMEVKRTFTEMKRMQDGIRFAKRRRHTNFGDV